MSATVLRCLHRHPVRGVTYRPHGKSLAVAGGEWFPTGRILDVRPADLPALEVDCDHQVVYCEKCKAATEYRRAAA